MIAACGEPKTPAVPTHHARPECPHGTFATELATLLPSLEPVRSVALIPIGNLDKKIEPGCVVPFRKEPDDRVIDVGRVVARTASRSEKGKAVLLGRGRLEIGRRAMRLSLQNDGGDETFSIVIAGSHVTLKEKGKKSFDADVALDSDSELPLPLDALVAAIDDCGSDERLGRTEDGNVVEARRGPLALWRARWTDEHRTAVIDTSYGCSKDDARLLWRTAIGDILPMLAVASARSDRVLVIMRHGQSKTEDVTDYGFSGMR